MKKVLVLCTGNSCRSIIAEALINHYLKGKVKAFSAGSDPAGRVNENAKRVLKEEGAWRDEYRSKGIEEIEKYAPFDLLVTVCDNAKESCPDFHLARKKIHIGFEDPDGKGYLEFVKTKNLIKEKLLKAILREFEV